MKPEKATCAICGRAVDDVPLDREILIDDSGNEWEQENNPICDDCMKLIEAE